MYETTTFEPPQLIHSDRDRPHLRLPMTEGRIIIVDYARHGMIFSTLPLKLQLPRYEKNRFSPNSREIADFMAEHYRLPLPAGRYERCGTLTSIETGRLLTYFAVTLGEKDARPTSGDWIFPQIALAGGIDVDIDDKTQLEKMLGQQTEQ